MEKGSNQVTKRTTSLNFSPPQARFSRVLRFDVVKNFHLGNEKS